jgi:excisionase family DNA binding protein
MRNERVSDNKEEVRDELVTYTVGQAMQITGLSRTTLYILMNNGELKYARVRRRRLIPRWALVELINRNIVAR